jgi:hypothetical protein
MRYLVDLTQKEAEEVRKFINAGKYETVAQFISTAIENQIHIENEGSEPLSSILSARKDPNILSKSDFIIAKDSRNITLVEIKSQPKTVDAPDFSELAASLYKTKEDNCWLWGQTNKVFPVKIGLRVLYAFIGTEQWLDLEDYKEKAANIAAEYGTAIRKYEDKKNKIRDDRISAGLPDEEEFKSKFRYKGHFLAHMRKDGKLDGAMPFLRFANLNKDEKGKIFIGLTEPGLNFARIENPVIDQNNFDKSFTEKEVDFYLNHILKNVKGEASAIKWVLHKLVSGVTNRREINKELKKEFSHIWDGASDAVINTQRAGLMARMYELELIDKKKEGITVTYIISDSGRKFLEKLNKV